jgi:hypothetical protein
MDYCSTCRRHLNGALVCPGCGAYAPDIAPLAVQRPAPAAETVTAPWQSPAHLWHDKNSGAEEAGEAPQEHPYDGPDAPAAPAPMGRAARRRQRERWKKTQRRALVATAVALVGGGLSAVAMDRQSTDRTQAASAPENAGAMGIAEEQATDPTPASSTTPAGTDRTKGTSSTGSSTTNAPHEQSATEPRATPTTQAAQQDSVTTQLNTTISTAESQATSTVSDTTDAVTETAASATPSATEDTGASSSSGSDTSSATPSPSESSSSSESTGLCLLGIVCIS